MNPRSDTTPTQWGPSGLPEMMMLRLDRDLVIGTVYRPDASVLALPADHVIGVPLADAVHPDFADAIMRVVVGAYSGKDSAEAGIQYGEDTLPTAAWEVSAYPIEDGGAVVVVRDMKNVVAVQTYEEMYLQRLRCLALDSEEVAQEERKLLAVELHDRVIQPLAAAHLWIQQQERHHRDSAIQLKDDGFTEIGQLLDSAITEARAITSELAPVVYYELGLRPALRALAEERLRASGLRCELSWEVPAQVTLSEGVSGLLYRSACELLTNVSKHAGVGACRLSVSCDGDAVRLLVHDEGAGFDPSCLFAPAMVGDGGFGLFSIREHVDRLGGEMDVITAPRSGTSVVITVPLSHPEF